MPFPADTTDVPKTVPVESPQLACSVVGPTLSMILTLSPEITVPSGRSIDATTEVIAEAAGTVIEF